MIRNYIIFRDYETSSTDKHTTQPLELAAVAIDLQRLEVVEDSVFCSLIQPTEPEKVEAQALGVNGLVMDELMEAPTAKIVWEQYKRYLLKYNLGGNVGGKWAGPISAGFNSVGFDDTIDERMCNTYGPKLTDRGWSIYHPFYKIDLLQLIITWFPHYTLTYNNSYSFDACREFFGISKEGAHRATKDVVDGANLLVKILQVQKEITNGKFDRKLGLSNFKF